MQKRFRSGPNGNRLVTPASLQITTSPGATSRTKRAPMMSSAQVSEVTIGTPSISPSTSGRTPIGSRTPMMPSLAIATRL
jgi:hypothetical protein